MPAFEDAQGVPREWHVEAEDRRGVPLAAVALWLVLPRVYAAGPAANPRDKFRGGNSVSIAANETVPHDLYLTGGTIRVDGRIEGDLVVAGGTIDITGPVTRPAPTTSDLDWP